MEKETKTAEKGVLVQSTMPVPLGYKTVTIDDIPLILASEHDEDGVKQRCLVGYRAYKVSGVDMLGVKNFNTSEEVELWSTVIGKVTVVFYARRWFSEEEDKLMYGIRFYESDIKSWKDVYK